ncbi:hypothetical protein T10_913 [Trichinella papuae]|uniref:Uncharacterized protein n=1 Tax=Trichinella papuae TaxID=268474 RepID=A0A0V1M2T6_9BILA|nr:hypothetical protein T10_913 [Trichinella papuae]
MPATAVVHIHLGDQPAVHHTVLAVQKILYPCLLVNDFHHKYGYAIHSIRGPAAQQLLKRLGLDETKLFTT